MSSHAGGSDFPGDGGPMRARGPPASIPLVAKAPRRRAPFACDECRSRKRACDTTRPCRPCRRLELGKCEDVTATTAFTLALQHAPASTTANVRDQLSTALLSLFFLANGGSYTLTRCFAECTYPRGAGPRPTNKIRGLQRRLRQAHGWLQHIQSNLPAGAALELDLSECLRNLDHTLPERESPSPYGGERGLYMPDGVRAGASMLYYGPFSDVAFILRTIETLQIVPLNQSSSEAAGKTVGNISDLLDRPLGPGIPRSVSNGNGLAIGLPLNAVELVASLLQRHDLILSFLADTDVRRFAANPLSSTVTPGSLPLMHLVLALAYLCNRSEPHLSTGCTGAAQTAWRHFEIGVSLNAQGDASSQVSMATRLCAAIFLLATGRHSASYSFVASTSSTALRLGLLSDPYSSESIIPLEARRPRLCLLATILCLNMIESTILDLPTSSVADFWAPEKLAKLALEAESRDDLRTAALLRQSALLTISLSARKQIPSGLKSHDHDSQKDLFRTALHEFRAWAQGAAPLMSRLASTQGHHSIQKELEMTYHLGHIILFRPHLHYIRDMYAGKRISLAESYYALVCMKAASSIIPLAESMAPQSGSWLTMHAVFWSAMCLVFLVAAHPATTLPSVAWQRARRAIRIIAARRCADNASALSLDILKVVTHTLQETIYIDFDRIEALTNDTYSLQIAADDRLVHGGDLSSLAGLRSAAGYDELSLAEGASLRGGEANNEPDRVLEQVEALETDVVFQDWLNFGDEDEESPPVT